MSEVGKHRAPKPETQKRHWLRAVAITTASVLLIVGVGGYLAYRHLNGNITGLDLNDEIGTDRPTDVALERPHKPMNILLLGSDTRAGETVVDGVAQGLSDTTILLHLSGDRERAYAVSIPRDLMVERPECRSKYDQNQTVAGGLSMFNAAYSVGGPACTIKTVESMTGIRIHHFVIVDFGGFRDMVDALGGVKMCVPKEVNDTERNIYLKAGTYNMTGKEALTFVRERHILSPNGDIGRMKRQQVFLAAMTNKVISAGTLINLPKLFNFLNAATKTITTDEEIASLKKLASLALEVQDIGLDRIQFLTIPIMTYAPDPNRLALAPEAEQVWERIRLDETLRGQVKDEVVKASDGLPGSKPTAKPTTAAQIAAEEERKAQAVANGLCA